MSRLLIFIICSLLSLSVLAAGQDETAAGPAYARFSLTLAPGWREEALGPLYYFQTSGEQEQWALPPFFCRTRTGGVDWSEWEVFYPLLDYRRFGTEYRLEIGQLISFNGGESANKEQTRRFTVFPFYFRQSSSNTDLNYTAVAPFYGHLRNRLFRDDIQFFLFPLFSETRKKDRVVDNYLYPIFDRRHGNQMSGWQVWPLIGTERKTPLPETEQAVPDTEGGHENFFLLWPFYFNNRSGLGTTNASANRTWVPFFSWTRSPPRDETSYGWPFGYCVIHDRAKDYREYDVLWPLFVQARGSKTVHRYFPFYSRAHNQDLESDFYAWPIYKFNRLESPPLERRRTRILFFVYSDTIEENKQTKHNKRRIDFWPFFSYHGDPDGNRQWQALAVLEPFFPNNRSIPREYSQVWSLWRAERNSQTDVSSESLLWNLYRHEETPHSKKTSLFFGLFQYQSTPDGGSWRVCYINIGKKPAAPVPPSS
ncbi:MAG: hypothetical protein ACLQVY_19120 [Limisphaerales bacterium]